jgi:hypothetical protein
MDERRRARRYEILFPMRLEAQQGGPGFAVSRNLSIGGTLMATATDLQLGAPVTVFFRVGGETEERRAEGNIVRVGTNEDDPYGMWPYIVGVRFLAAMPDLDPLLEKYTVEDER